MGRHSECMPCPSHASRARRDDERDADFVADDAEAEDEGAPGRPWASMRANTSAICRKARRNVAPSPWAHVFAEGLAAYCLRPAQIVRLLLGACLDEV
jgi:hypothetical protein